MNKGGARSVATSIGGDGLRLVFSYDGRIQSVMGRAGELADTVHAARGFYLDNGYEQIPLTEISYGNGRLTCSTRGGQWAVFVMECRRDYLVFRLRELRGIPANNGFVLCFEVRGEGIQLLELDYMTEKRQEDGWAVIRFPYLYAGEINPLGGFVLYERQDEEQEDELLLTIWGEQGLPHPKTKKPWSVSTAREWVDDWCERFADRSQMIIHANCEEELYQFFPYLERMKAKQVYLFTDTWRSDPFWPQTGVNWALNERVFPRGVESLQTYAQALEKHGLKLMLHYVSGGIGFYDPVYVGERPDERLAGWGRMRLTKEILPQAKTVFARPEPGVELPFTFSSGLHSIRFPGLSNFFQWRYLQLENEILRFADVEVLEDGCWRFDGCIRGLFHTKEATHAPGTYGKGLLAPYDINFIPDNDSSLLDEIAQGYAGLINAAHIQHTEFDGGEIHVYEPWGYRKFTQKVYEALDHPVTAHDSSGHAPRSYFHYRLNRVRRLVEGDCSWGHINHHAHIKPYSHSRKATNFLDAHYCLSLGHVGTALGVALPEPMFGESLADLQGHGGTDTLLQTVVDWKEAAKCMPSQVHRFIEESFHPAKGYWKRYNSHRQADYLCRLLRHGESWRIVPTYVMRRRSGDISWQFAQEHGCLSPRQFLRAGEPVELENPVGAQVPKCLLQVLWHVDENGERVDARKLAEHMMNTTDPYAFFQETNLGEDTHEADPRPNLDITPRLSELTVTGDMSVSEGEGGLYLRYDNPRDEEILDDRMGASWKLPCDMRNHRGMAITVTGDASGAVLVIMAGRRDYAVKLDFRGEKTVVIPHGEAAWYNGDWGWRLQTKSTDYKTVEDFRIALGYVPAKTRVSVKLTSICALREEPVTLSHVFLHVGGGCLRLCSQGGIRSGDILYADGESAMLYDKNWFYRETLKIEAPAQAERGWNLCELGDEGTGHPFYELQLLVEGTPLEFTTPEEIAI